MNNHPGNQDGLNGAQVATIHERVDREGVDWLCDAYCITRAQAFDLAAKLSTADQKYNQLERWYKEAVDDVDTARMAVEVKARAISRITSERAAHLEIIERQANDLANANNNAQNYVLTISDLEETVDRLEGELATCEAEFRAACLDE